MCYPEVQKDTCDVHDNSTVIDASGFEQSNIMYGPALPPHSWQTKVGCKLLIQAEYFISQTQILSFGLPSSAFKM